METRPCQDREHIEETREVEVSGSKPSSAAEMARWRWNLVEKGAGQMSCMRKGEGVQGDSQAEQ